MATFDSQKDFKKAQEDLLELADKWGVEITEEEKEALSKLPEGTKFKKKEPVEVTV